MTLLWDTDPAAAERIAYAVGGEVIPCESTSALTRALAEGVEDLVIIGPDVDIDAACDLADRVRVEHPHVGILLLRRRLDVTVLGQALRSGIREALVADDLPGLSDAMRRSRDISSKMMGQRNTPAQSEGRIITVFSAKGGVGKTTFSSNVAAYLASTGSRVLLIDLDLAFGDVGISLQLLPQRSMIDLLSMAGHLDERGLRSVVTTHECGLDTICAPSEPSDADRIPAATISELLGVAKRHYDFVVVDTPPAFTSHVLAAFDLSDLLVLIATLDIPAVKNLRLTLDTLNLLGSPRNARVVVLNRSDAKVGLRAADVVGAIKTDIAIEVPSSISVPASVNRGVPIILDEPKHPVSVALRRLTDDHLRPARTADGTIAAEPTAERRRERWLMSRGGRR